MAKLFEKPQLGHRSVFYPRPHTSGSSTTGTQRLGSQFASGLYASNPSIQFCARFLRQGLLGGEGHHAHHATEEVQPVGNTHKAVPMILPWRLKGLAER